MRTIWVKSFGLAALPIAIAALSAVQSQPVAGPAPYPKRMQW